jgi:glucokinase
MGAGAGVPAVVNPATGTIEQAGGLHWLNGVKLKPALEGAAGLAAVVESSVNAAAFGELTCGSARGVQNAMYLDLGPSISAALVLEGKLFRGFQGYAGGFGHITVNPDGLACDCGNHGCLETIASGANFVRRTKERLFRDRSSSLSSLALPEKGELTPQRIAMEALDGDDFALMMLQRTGRWVGLALADAVNLLNLDLVVLAGPVVVAGEAFLNPVSEEMRKRALPSPANHCRIVTPALGGQAELIGAAMLAREMVAGEGCT